MEPERRLNDLFLLRDEIAALSIVLCRMSHERVIRAADTMLPVVSRTTNSYERVGLCSPETRTQRLGCSHTTARIKLETAIKELEKGNNDCEAVSLLANELNYLDNEIHLLDHRKGEAEKTLARILEEMRGTDDPAHMSERLTEAENEVRAMECLHDELVDRIGVLRDTVMTEIDKLIDEAGERDSSRYSVIESGKRTTEVVRYGTAKP